jgi:hypothetical protein
LTLNPRKQGIICQLAQVKQRLLTLGEAASGTLVNNKLKARRAAAEASTQPVGASK